MSKENIDRAELHHYVNNYLSSLSRVLTPARLTPARQESVYLSGGARSNFRSKSPGLGLAAARYAAV